jgi:hypothetical protein
VILGLLVAVVAAWHAWRNQVRRELVDYLRAHAPEIEIAAVHAGRLELKFDGTSDTATFHLERLFQKVADQPVAATPDERQAARLAIFASVVKTLREGRAGLGDLDSETERANVLPRIVHDAALGELRRKVEANGKMLPAAPIGVPGLSVVLVLDREASVAYLSEDLLAELGVTTDQAFELARVNLAKRFNREIVRQTVAGGAINVVKCGDTFDAARLLLVPAYLEEGETLAAAVPDRDTLVLTAPPADGDWAGLRKMARAAAGDPLYTEPLVVTPSGIARAA